LLVSWRDPLQQARGGTRCPTYTLDLDRCASGATAALNWSASLGNKQALYDNLLLGALWHSTPARACRSVCHSPALWLPGLPYSPSGGDPIFRSVCLTAIDIPFALGGAEPPAFIHSTTRHSPSRFNTSSTTSATGDHLVRDLVSPNAAWASTTSPLAARSDLPLRAPRTWPGQPSRVARPGAVSSAVCVRPPPPWDRLTVCSGAQSATMPPTSGPPDGQSASATAGRSDSVSIHSLLAYMFLGWAVFSSYCIWPTPLGHCLCHPFHSLRSSLVADPVSQAVGCTTLYLGLTLSTPGGHD